MAKMRRSVQFVQGRDTLPRQFRAYALATAIGWVCAKDQIVRTMSLAEQESPQPTRSEGFQAPETNTPQESKGQVRREQDCAGDYRKFSTARPRKSDYRSSGDHHRVRAAVATAKFASPPASSVFAA